MLDFGLNWLLVCAKNSYIFFADTFSQNMGLFSLYFEIIAVTLCVSDFSIVILNGKQISYFQDLIFLLMIVYSFS